MFSIFHCKQFKSLIDYLVNNNVGIDDRLLMINNLRTLSAFLVVWLFYFRTVSLSNIKLSEWGTILDLSIQNCITYFSSIIVIEIINVETGMVSSG